MENKPASFWRDRLPGPVLAAAAGCFFAGFFAHLFAFTNIIPNSDGISRVFDAQQMTVSGRWFLHYASAWNGYVQAPAVIGFFALLFLALAAGLTASLLRIRSLGLSALCGALLSVFPSVAYTFLYLFTASAYCFGILLAVLSVWLVSRYKYGFLFAAPVLACAVGTYQAYLAVAASLSLICVILHALEGHSTREIARLGLKYLAFLALGLGLYALILWIFLRVKELELLDYKGLSSLGDGMTLGKLLREIGAAYRGFRRYFFVPRSFANYTTSATVVGNVVLGLTALCAFFRVLCRSGCHKRPGAFALTLALCALLPLALNLTVLMGEAMPIMRYALVLAYVFALVLVDRAREPEAPAGQEKGKTASGKSAAKAPQRGADGRVPSQRGADGRVPSQRGADGRVPSLRAWAACCAAGLLLILSFQIDNLAYTVSAQAHRATESFATRLVERVETTPGYRNGMEVVIIGGFPSKVYHSQIEAFSLVEDYSNLSSSVIPLNKHVYYYLNDWLNVPWQMPDEETMISVSDSGRFQAMPLYPDDGSVAIVDGRLVVKLASKYTPKKAYEIAYENRR